jgi:hypothetical protein
VAAKKKVADLSVWVPPVPTPKPVPVKKPAPVAVPTQVDPQLVRLAKVLAETGKIRHRHNWLKYGEYSVEQVWAGPEMFSEFALFQKIAYMHARYTVLHEAVARRAEGGLPAFKFCRTCGTADCWAAVWTLDLLHAALHDVTG